MITEFVRAWDARKSHLEKWFKRTNQEKLSYDVILAAIIDEVINPSTTDGNKYDSLKIHIIDDGDYQGCQIFIVPLKCYQPSPYQYITTYQDYGSCSGCDLLEGIRKYDSGTPTEEQVKEYMILALHLLQRLRFYVHYETYLDEE